MAIGHENVTLTDANGRTHVGRLHLNVLVVTYSDPAIPDTNNVSWTISQRLAADIENASKLNPSDANSNRVKIHLLPQVTLNQLPPKLNRCDMISPICPSGCDPSTCCNDSYQGNPLPDRHVSNWHSD